jgi:hypothetical protein
MTKTNKFWSELFDKHSILDKIHKYGFFEITSKQINEYWESRLMTKFDHKSNLPELFQKYKLSILPKTRGSYIISDFNAYQDIQYNTSIETSSSFPESIETIDPQNLYSESIALNCAYISGLIDSIAGESTEHTVNGRMSTLSFDYQIRTIQKLTFNMQVNNSQCEIDGGYEGPTKFVLVEAKNFQTNDFLIRQLYYPFRLWRQKTKKEIIPVFMTFSNDVFSFFIYRFEDFNDYNSIVLVEQKNFCLISDSITLDDLVLLFKNTPIIKDPPVPFPQADSFERVVDLLGLLFSTELSKDDITTNYDFDKRQTDYYTNAGIYLGLIQKRPEGREVKYALTDAGRKVMSQKGKYKYLSLAKAILQHDVFHRLFHKCLNTSLPATSAMAEETMRECPLYKVKEKSTYFRRSQTVAKWIDWILKLQNN